VYYRADVLDRKIKKESFADIWILVDCGCLARIWDSNLFIPDGQKLVSGGGDGLMRVWDLTAGDPAAVTMMRACGRGLLPPVAIPWYCPAIPVQLSVSNLWLIIGI